MACIDTIIASGDYPEIGYKRAMGLIQLHRAYGSQRLDNACKRAIQADAVAYRRIKNILKNNLDQSSLFFQDLEEDRSHIPVHENIREHRPINKYLINKPYNYEQQSNC